MANRVGGALTLYEAQTLIERPNFRDDIEKAHYNTNDIIQLIKKVHDINIAKGRTKRLAERLRGRNDKQTLENVYYFVQNNIRYIKDTNGYERVKEDNSTIYEGYGDCKAMSLLICSIVSHYGFEYQYKFVKYIKYFFGVPSVSQHVYPIVISKDGTPYCLDAVNTYGGFNSELPYDELIGVISTKNYPLSIGEQVPQTQGVSAIFWFLAFGLGVLIYKSYKN